MNYLFFLKPFLRRVYHLVFLHNVSDIGSESSSSELSFETSLSAGWYVIRPEYELHCVEASIFLDLGLGFEEAYRVPLNCINDVVASSVVELPARIKKLRLFIRGNGGNNEARLPFSFVPICRAEAVARIACYIYQINSLRDISMLQVLQEKVHQIRKAGVVNIIRNLSGFYDYGDTEGPLGYGQWIQRNERLDDVARQQIYDHVFMYNPLISLVCIMPDDLKLVSDTIDSLLQQTYKNWQIVLVVVAEEEDGLAAFMQQFPLAENQLKFCIIDHDVSLFGLPEVLPLLAGEYAQWLRAGDRLSPYALHWWVDAINNRPDVVAWYCDSDFLGADGQRKKPHFRPDWNRELFYSLDYIGNACLFKFSTIVKLVNDKGLVSYAGIYDLLLRISASEEEGQVGHVAKMLYHHCLAAQTSMNTLESLAGQHQALKHHFAVQGKNLDVGTGLLTYTHRIFYPLPDILPSVTLVIPTRDQVKILKKCIETVIEHTKYPKFDVLVVDNGSTESATKKYLAKIQEKYNVRVVEYDKPFNFAAINNHAAHLLNTDMICMLNNDIEIMSANWLLEMVRYGVQADVGCVGAKLLYANDTVQHAGVICGLGDVAGHAHHYLPKDGSGYYGRLQSPQYYSAVTAACLLVRKEVWDEVGGMAEELAVAYNDIDFCLRVKAAGYKNVYTPYAELYHHESISRGPEDSPEKLERYQREVDYMWQHWEDELINDDCYNPNLSRLREDFSL